MSLSYWNVEAHRKNFGYNTFLYWDEGQNELFNVFSYDIEGDDLTYSITEGININVIEQNTGEFIFIPDNPNYFGSETFSISVTDGEFFDSNDLIVNVNPINDTPVIVDIDNNEIKIYAYIV